MNNPSYRFPDGKGQSRVVPGLADQQTAFLGYSTLSSYMNHSGEHKPASRHGTGLSVFCSKERKTLLARGSCERDRFLMAPRQPMVISWRKYANLEPSVRLLPWP